MSVHPSGFYAWLKEPLSQRAKEDRRVLAQIKQFWMESGFIYGYRNITINSNRIIPDIQRGWNMSKWMLLNVAGMFGASQNFPWIIILLIDTILQPTKYRIMPVCFVV